MGARGASWGTLGVILGGLWGALGHLGASWGYPGASWSVSGVRLETPGGARNLVKPMVFDILANPSSRVILEQT